MTDPRIKLARQQIAKKGQLVTWRQIEDGMPLDPTKPWIVAESEVLEYQVSIVFLPDTRFNFQGSKFHPTTEVPTGFGVALMGAQEFIPKIKDVIIRNGVEMVVRNLRTLSPAGESLLYEMELGE